jgi:hypothetical protein
MQVINVKILTPFSEYCEGQTCTLFRTQES